jgi:hypothetical protein
MQITKPYPFKLFPFFQLRPPPSFLPFFENIRRAVEKTRMQKRTKKGMEKRIINNTMTISASMVAPFSILRKIDGSAKMLKFNWDKPIHQRWQIACLLDS